MRVRFVVGSVCLLVLSPFVSRAQDPGQEAARGPDGRVSVHVPGVEVLAIPNLPFTASTETEWISTLQDGSTVRRHLVASIARDSAGRVYRERRHFVPDQATVAPAYETIVYDPTTSTRTTCTTALRRCVIQNFRPATQFRLMPVGPFANGTGYLTRDALGTNTMQDLAVTGTRETETWNPGVMGNTRPLVKTREFWYSPALQTNLAVSRNDPTLGQQIIALSNVSRSEPEAAQFAVPAGFTVVDARTAKTLP